MKLVLQQNREFIQSELILHSYTAQTSAIDLFKHSQADCK